MSITTAKIARNTGVLTASLIIQKVFSFIYFSYLATQLGITQTGLYFFVLSLVGIASVFIDFGLINAVIREVSKKPEDASKYYRHAIAVRLILAFVVLLAFYTYTLLSGFDLLTKQSLLIAGLIMTIDSFTLLFYSFWRAHHNTMWESLGNIIFQITLLSVGGVLIYLSQSILLALLALLLASSINFLLAFFSSRLKLNLRFKWEIDYYFIKKLLLIALPFALAGIFSRVYGYADTFLLKNLVGDTALGYYSLPYKITFVWQFIPLAAIATLYPAFTNYFTESREKLSILWQRSSVLLLALALPLTVGLYIFAQVIFFNIYGIEFMPSSYALQVMILTLPLLFLNFPLGYLLNASGMQSRNTINIFIAMVVSIIGNIILMPMYSFIAASFMSIISTMVLFVLGMSCAVRIVKIDFRGLIRDLFKILFALVGMIAIILIIGSSLHYLLTILIAATTYILLVFIVKLVSVKDIRVFIKR
ncbi:flippase [Patescibacteria group bacterium]|nr:flippase [Patescibacteria group bacterium]